MDARSVRPSYSKCKEKIFRIGYVLFFGLLLLASLCEPAHVSCNSMVEHMRSLEHSLKLFVSVCFLALFVRGTCYHRDLQEKVHKPWRLTLWRTMLWLMFDRLQRHADIQFSVQLVGKHFEMECGRSVRIGTIIQWKSMMCARPLQAYLQIVARNESTFCLVTLNHTSILHLPKFSFAFFCFSTDTFFATRNGSKEHELCSDFFNSRIISFFVGSLRARARNGHFQVMRTREYKKKNTERQSAHNIAGDNWISSGWTRVFTSPN